VASLEQDVVLRHRDNLTFNYAASQLYAFTFATGQRILRTEHVRFIVNL